MNEGKDLGPGKDRGRLGIRRIVPSGRSVPLIIAVVGLLGFGTLTSVGAFSAPSQQDKKESPSTGAYAVGVSRASHVAAIAAEQAGTIVELPVAEGEVVITGKIVFRLSSRLQQLRVDRLTTLTKSDLSVRRALAALEHSNRLASHKQSQVEIRLNPTYARTLYDPVNWSFPVPFAAKARGEAVAL